MAQKLMSLIFLGVVLLYPSLCNAQSKTAALPILAPPSGALQTDKLRQSAPAMRMDVTQCIALALQNNYRSKISRDSVAMAFALHQQALSSWWPQITGSVRATRMDEDPNFIFPSSSISLPLSAFSVPASAIALPVDAQIPTPPMPIDAPALTIPIPEQNIKLMNRDILLASLNLTLPIYTGGLRGARIKQAQAGVDAAQQDERRTDLEVIYDVKRLYYATVMTGQLITISKDTLARMEATLELTEKMYTTGSGTVKKTDFLRNKSIVETIRSAVADIESQEKVIRVTLLMVMGLDMGMAIELADKEIPFSSDLADPKALIDIAFAANPDIAKVSAALKAAEGGVTAAISGHLPKFALIGNAQKIVNSYDSGVATSANKENWMVGIGVEIPIFQGFRVSHEVREQKANLQKLQHQLALLRESTALEIRSTCFNLQKASQQEQSSRKALKSATENRELNIRAYQEELVETKEVIEAQLMEALMAAQYQKVLFDHMQARAKLDFVAGGSQRAAQSSAK